MAQIADEKVQLAQVESALVTKYGDHIPPELISAYVREGLAEFADARIRTFLPVLLHKRMTDRLRHAGGLADVG